MKKETYHVSHQFSDELLRALYTAKKDEQPQVFRRLYDEMCGRETEWDLLDDIPFDKSLRGIMN